MDLEPGLGLGFRNDREDLDFFVGDVIENAYLFNAEAVLRLSEPTKALDAAFGRLRRLVPEVRPDGILDRCALVCWKRQNRPGRSGI